jgi:hypothetical protein
MLIPVLYLCLLAIGNILYNLKNSELNIRIFRKRARFPNLPYPDLIFNSAYLWLIYVFAHQSFTVLIVSIVHSGLSILYLLRPIQVWFRKKSVDFNAFSSTIFFYVSYLYAQNTFYKYLALSVVLLFTRNAIVSLIKRESLLEFDKRLKYFGGYFLALQVFAPNSNSILVLSVVYFIIDIFGKLDTSITQYSKRIFGTNKVVSNRYDDFEKHLLFLVCIALLIQNESFSRFISSGVNVLAALLPLLILYENVFTGLNISSDARRFIVVVNGVNYKSVSAIDNIKISKGLGKASYSTYYLDHKFYINFYFGLWPVRISILNYFIALTNRDFIHINMLGANLDYSSSDFKEFKEQFVVQKFIARKRNEIKTAIHISEDLDDKYNYQSTIEDYIAKNHLVSAAKLSNIVKKHIVDCNLYIEDLYNRGIFDLNIMHKRNSSIGDVSLRLMANLNFIEISTRFLVILTHLEKGKELDLGSQISFGLMVSKLRDMGVADESKHDTSTYLGIIKCALSDLKYKGKVPKKQSLINLLDIATYIRNKTQGHGSALHISDEIWLTSEIISYHILLFIYNYFGSVYFYKKIGDTLFESRHGLHLRLDLKIMCDEDFFIRFKHQFFKSNFIIPFEDYWYIIDSVRSDGNEYICFINGDRVRPDIIQADRI